MRIDFHHASIVWLTVLVFAGSARSHGAETDSAAPSAAPIEQLIQSIERIQKDPIAQERAIDALRKQSERTDVEMERIDLSDEQSGAAKARRAMLRQVIAILGAPVEREAAHEGLPTANQAFTTEPTDLDDSIARARSQHWAFQPIRFPPLPEVRAADWASTPIDLFILKKLEARGLTPSPRADRRTLIRRAAYDLTGLPPTAEEIAAFDTDRGEDAWSELVDRLLASPHYGERWGRYWLDLARYADTKGYVFQEERRFAYSYTYRDYVIGAFNRDLPYNEFILEQIAADRLDLGADRGPLAAMGMLTIGRRFIGNVHDIIDDRIDVVTRGFMGLTVTCARCHDHKYDPIPSADYYSLYGVFRSSAEPGELPLIADPDPDDPGYRQYLHDIEAKEEAVQNFLAEKHRALLEELQSRAGEYMLAAHDARGIEGEEAFQKLMRDRKLHGPIVRRWQTFLKKTAEAHHPVLAPWHGFAALAPEDFKTAAANLAGRYAAASDADHPVNRRVARMFDGEPPRSMEEVAARYGKLFAEAPADGSEDETDPARAEVRAVIEADGVPAHPPLGDLMELLDIPTRADHRRRVNAVERLKATHPHRPARAMVLNDADQLFDPYVFKRGNPDNKGEAVPRRFLAVLSDGERKPFENGSGRLELAEAIASDRNPLTARVLVNRVWMHHFGKPLVATPSDFGLRSEPPTHPELLDYLAWRFMREGWSIKKLHRWIMESSVYRQASDDDPARRASDPENRLLWRFNRRRLGFEAMRDTLLAASDDLDPTLGGESVSITSEPFATRRTIYGRIERQNLPGLFRTFDFPNPDVHSPQRHHTTVPQQALFLMNSPFVIQRARRLARLPRIADATRASTRIQRLYARLYGRPPTDEEIRLADEFLLIQGLTPPPEPPPPPVWQYGYGELDEADGRTKSFTPLPAFHEGRWSGGRELPDSELQYCMLSGQGGHPGNRVDTSAIRRWVAPLSGIFAISGRLRHGRAEGDGVIAYVVSESGGLEGHWTAHDGEAETAVERIEVNRGKAIDFIVACGANDGYDSFEWAPKIEMIECLGDAASWDAEADFQGPEPPRPEPLEPWEEYAQVLLMSDELIFVD